MKNFTRVSFLVKALISLLLICGSFQLFAGEIIITQGKTGITFSGTSYQKLDFTIQLSSIQFRDIQTPEGLFTELFV